MLKVFTLLSPLALSVALAGILAPSVLAATEVPITRIDFAGAGGDFQHRTGRFVVPDRDTTVSAYGGLLRRYDVHIAKMIEVTASQWCNPRPNFAGVYWNYEADNGNQFMGEFYISCATAQQAVKTYGLGRSERTFIYHRGQGPQTVLIPVLDLNGTKIPRFLKFVQTLKPCFNNNCR